MMGEEPTRLAIYYKFETTDYHFMDSVLKVVYEVQGTVHLPTVTLLWKETT